MEMGPERNDEGYVMQLQNFSVNDGEGIRTTIFLCGCPLDCIWCCNPENTRGFDGIHHRTVKEIDRVISRQSVFYRRCGGGITFSGGEATVQQGFLRSLAEHFYDKGYHLSIETCGVFEFDEVKDILEKMDMIFLDIKMMDSGVHRLFTGRGNEQILYNAEQIEKRLRVPMVLRIPVISGVNACPENISRTCLFLKEHVPSAKLEFLPYHRFGTDKYKELELPSPDERYGERRDCHPEGSIPEWFSWEKEMEVPSEECLRHCRKIAEDLGVEVVSYR